MSLPGTQAEEVYPMTKEGGLLEWTVLGLSTSLVLHQDGPWLAVCCAMRFFLGALGYAMVSHCQTFMYGA